MPCVTQKPIFYRDRLLARPIRTLNDRRKGIGPTRINVLEGRVSDKILLCHQLGGGFSAGMDIPSGLG